MAVNIKNPEAERLARELAARTGENLTTAVTTALRERLERLQHTTPDAGSAERVEHILALSRDIAARLTEPWASQDHGDLLYDDTGLPR